MVTREMKIKKPRIEEKQQAPEALNNFDGQQKSSEPQARTDSTLSHSSNRRRKVSPEAIDRVHKLIEMCIQSYKNKDEAIAILSNYAKIDPGFTSLVWQRLEKENAEFFSDYYVRLKLLEQISTFNKLLEEQCQLTKQRQSHYAMLSATQNGLQHMPENSMAGSLAPQLSRIPSNGLAHVELPFVGSCPVAYGVPAPGSLYSTHMDAMKIGVVAGVNHELDVSCGSFESSGQASLATDDTLQTTMDPMMSDPNLLSDICSKQLAQYDGNRNTIYNPSSPLLLDLTNWEDFVAFSNTHPSSHLMPFDTDTFPNSPKQCETVNDFTAGAAPLQNPELMRRTMDSNSPESQELISLRNQNR